MTTAPERRRDDLPRRVGDVLGPALERITGSDQARAYAAWTAAVGGPVAACTRPVAFARGRLTVECASSVWANELLYLGAEILRRMEEVAPGQPVERFRFIIARGRPDGAETDGLTRHGQENEAAAAKQEERQTATAPAASGGARAEAEETHDERLRAAIEGALRPASEGPGEAPGRGTPSG